MATMQVQKKFFDGQCVELCVFYSQIPIIEFSFLKSKSKPLILNRKCILSHKFISHNPAQRPDMARISGRKCVQFNFFMIILLLL
jgi:hypothetical protein